MSHDDDADRDPEATSPIPAYRHPRQNADGSYKIPAERLSILQAGVDKLNKRAAKLGMQPVTIVASAPRAEQYMKVIPGDLAHHLPKAEYPATRWVMDVRLDGTVPVIDGFAFIAKLDHLEGGNLVLRAPGFEGDLDGWRVVGSRCQHCGLDRSRAATFLVREAGGGIIQVGRQCLQDYTRSVDVESAVKLFKCWSELLAGGSDEDSEGWGFGGYSPAPTPVEYIAAAVAAVRKLGFHKADSERSTRKVCDFTTSPCPTDKGNRGDREAIAEWKSLQPSDAQRAQAAEILAWALATNDSSDYMHNARLACAERTVRSRTEGILASLPSSYDKAMGREQERRERPVAGPHVGAVGERITIKVTVKYVTGFTNDWGSGVLMILVDDNNSAFKVRATGHLARLSEETDGFKDGTWYVRGTVKKHDRNPKRNNDPITVLIRCDMQREEFPPLKPKKTKKAKPASKGAPLYGYKTVEPGVAGVVTILAHEWICPPGVSFSWDARREGDQLHVKVSSAWFSHVKPHAESHLAKLAAGGIEF